MSILASDSFNRANGALLGSTLDNSAGGSETDAWVSSAPSAGTWAIVSNQATGLNIGSNAVAAVSVPVLTSDHQVSVKTYSSDCGPIARLVDTANFYLFY